MWPAQMSDYWLVNIFRSSYAPMKLQPVSLRGVNAPSVSLCLMILIFFCACKVCFPLCLQKNNNNADLSLGTCKHYCLWLSIEWYIFTAPAWGREVKSWLWSLKTTTSCFGPSHAYIWSNGLWMWSWQSIMFLFLFFECGLLGLMKVSLDVRSDDCKK